MPMSAIVELGRVLPRSLVLVGASFACADGSFEYLFDAGRHSNLPLRIGNSLDLFQKLLCGHCILDSCDGLGIEQCQIRNATLHLSQLGSLARFSL